MNSRVDVGSFIVVHFVEQQLEGWEFKRAHWPLHITLVPWFTVADEEATNRSLERIAQATSPMTLKVGGIENFGMTRDIPVNVIVNQAPVRELHNDLIETLLDTDKDFSEQNFVGKEFMAHITRHEVDKKHSNAGEKILVTNYHVVRLTDATTCRVERQFDFAGVN